MITLTLLHPVQGTAVQSWSFRHDQNVRIGRAVDNEVVLYSAVVSRHHVELRHEQGRWYVHNLGINGTFLEGRKIESEPLESGQTIRLARSGPNIQVIIQSQATDAAPSLEADSASPATSAAKPFQGTQIEPHLNLSAALEDQSLSESPASSQGPNTTRTVCHHDRSPKSSLICIDCGEPMNVLRTVGPYKVLKHLGERETTFQAWKNKKTYVLRTAPTQVFADPQLRDAYHYQLQLAENLNYGGIPRMIEVLEDEGQFYLVYEMVYGLSLKKWVSDRGVLSLPSAISWITEIARIVEYLHQLEPPFIHQGINPNTIIRPTIPQGSHSLMLVNFGQYDYLVPQKDRMEGDLAYCSPYQDASSLSIKLDLYALGATFLFMLTGSDPYKFLRLGDRAYILNVDESFQIPPKTLAVIGSLLQTQDSRPIPSATEAIDKFVHLI